MRVILLPDAATFLNRTQLFRSQQPYLTNVMGSTATSISAGLRTYEKMSWWIVEDSRGAVCAMMMRTAPHKLVLSPMPDEVIAMCVEAVLERDPDIPGVSGSRRNVESFLRTFVGLSSTPQRFEVERSILVYVLGTLRVSARSEGFKRTCDKNDFDFLLAWWQSFADDTGVERHGLEEGLRTSINQGRVFVWMSDNVPVCAVGHSPIVVLPRGSVVRIGPVYTPPQARRHGYAGQLTGAVSRDLVQRGIGLMLFTDAANPTSNGVYVRLGYKKIDEIVECTLEPAQGYNEPQRS
jgi:predicted GNAT family acetyltransferase